MAQIAQQDHLFIDASGVTDALKAKLIECYKAGTILDVVLRGAATGDGKSSSTGVGKSISKCISAGYKDAGTTRTYTCVFGGGQLAIITAKETISA